MSIIIAVTNKHAEILLAVESILMRRRRYYFATDLNDTKERIDTQIMRLYQF